MASSSLRHCYHQSTCINKAFGLISLVTDQSAESTQCALGINAFATTRRSSHKMLSLRNKQGVTASLSSLAKKPPSCSMEADIVNRAGLHKQ